MAASGSSPSPCNLLSAPSPNNRPNPSHSHQRIPMPWPRLTSAARQTNAAALTTVIILSLERLALMNVNWGTVATSAVASSRAHLSSGKT